MCFYPSLLFGHCASVAHTCTKYVSLHHVCSVCVCLCGSYAFREFRLELDIAKYSRRRLNTSALLLGTCLTNKRKTANTHTNATYIFRCKACIQSEYTFYSECDRGTFTTANSVTVSQSVSVFVLQQQASRYTRTLVAHVSECWHYAGFQSS